jgi:hypothetical protein
MSRTNPYEKYLGKEDIMHAEIVRVIELRFPDLFWWHTPNEGKRSAFEQYKFKTLGGKKGVSDFVILEDSNFSKGLMMEIKYGGNGCSKAQVDFLIDSINKGYTSAVVYNHASDAISLLERHLGSGACFPLDGILLIKEGKESIIQIEQAHKVLMKKSTPVSDKQQAKKLFEAEAKKKFGNVSVQVKKALFQGKDIKV